MSRRFDDATVLITGAAGGIGQALCARFASGGARIVAAVRDAHEAEHLAAQLQGCGRLTTVVADVADEKQVVALFDAAGAVDVVVNNAGLMPFKPVAELTMDDWTAVLFVDLLGAFWTTRELLRRATAGGAVVNVASIHALAVEAQAATYAAAKAGVLSLTRSGAVEGRAQRVRVNAVLPGAIDTPMLWSNPNVKSGDEHVDPAEVGAPDDVAEAVAFLASRDAKFINGTTLVVDGGRMAHL